MQVNQRKAGVIISYIGQFVHILTGLIYTPIMLRLLGQSEYGLYQLVYSVVSYLSLLSLGFGSSYMRFYSREKASHNEEGVAKLNGMFMLIFSTISIICILCGIAMLFNIRAIFGNGLTETEYSKAKVLLIIMVMDLALTFPNSVFNCIVTSQEKFLFQKTLILVQYIANPFLCLPLLLLGYGSIGMVAATTFITLLVLCTNIYYCLKKLNAHFLFRGLQLSLLKEMGIFTFFIFLNQIIDQINLSVDKFLLGRMIGTSAVAIYGVGGQINTLYMQLSTSVSNVFVPEVNRIVAEQDNDQELSRIFIKVGRIQFLILSLIVSGFIFFGVPFIQMWAGNEYKEAYYVALLLMLPVTVPLIQNIGIEIQRAKNKHKTRSVVYFLIAIANIGISIPLIKSYGPIGATLGTAISLIIGNFLFMNWYYHKRINIDIPMFWRSILSFIPGFIIPVIFGIISMRYFTIKGVPSLLIGLAVYTLLFCCSMYFFAINQEEKEMINGLFNKFKSFLKRRSSHE